MSVDAAAFTIISQGLASIALFHVDLIVCDIMMPTLDGRKMCHIIRANPRYESMPILLMSASNEQVRRQFAAVGMFHLVEPGSLQSGLAQRGFAVERVQWSGEGLE